MSLPSAHPPGATWMVYATGTAKIWVRTSPKGERAIFPGPRGFRLTTVHEKQPPCLEDAMGDPLAVLQEALRCEKGTVHS